MRKSVILHSKIIINDEKSWHRIVKKSFQIFHAILSRLIVLSDRQRINVTE